jgi:hypothetical protein
VSPTLFDYLFSFCDTAKRFSFFSSSSSSVVVSWHDDTLCTPSQREKLCLNVFPFQKAPERRFNGCLHQIRKTITKIHIKFIVVSLSLSLISRLQYFCAILFTFGILMFALYRRCDLMDFCDEMFFSNFAIFLRRFSRASRVWEIFPLFFF